MPIFSLPLAPYSLSHKHVSARYAGVRKRKRGSSTSSEESRADDDSDGMVGDVEAAAAAAAATNPLSLTPAEVVQYRLAGLGLHEELPGTTMKDWPHRGLREEWSFEDEDEGDGRKGKGGLRRREEEVVRQQTQTRVQTPNLRSQHIGVVTAILMRCLNDGDIQRAERAWAMLIRQQFAGKGADLRGSGYWGIGAELLIRGNEKRRRRDEEDDDDNDAQMEGEDQGKGEKRWGTRETMEVAKDYYERLILQYPYKRQFHNSITALDFWPAMLGCEIYGIQYEWKEALRALEDADGDADDEESVSESDDSATGDDDESQNDGFARRQRRVDRRRSKLDEKRWTERDEIRKTALLASESIAARMDDLMTVPPYSDSHVLLRLRGMLALYVGDLAVPAQPIRRDVKDGDGGGASASAKERERRFLVRNREADYRRGMATQRAERVRAKKWFETIEMGGGRVGVDLNGLLEVEMEDGAEDGVEDDTQDGAEDDVGDNMDVESDDRLDEDRMSDGEEDDD